MGEYLIEAQNITKKFDGQKVIDDVSFAIEKGEILAIIGPNGSGKSTLAKIVMGLEEADSGQSLINGHEPENERKRIGYVPQRFNFNREIPMSVIEFLELSLPDLEHGNIEEHLSEAGMLHMKNARIGTLSGGQLQRVMVARALSAKKDILVLDEPSTGIDVSGQKTLYELMQKVNREQNATVILISHELEVVFRYASSVLCINKEALCHGVPEEVVTPEILAKLYGGKSEEYHHMKHH